MRPAIAEVDIEVGLARGEADDDRHLADGESERPGFEIENVVFPSVVDHGPLLWIAE